ncbi:hypothetical protein GOP47_0014184, partial [Adiantum capillus-veneris]
RHLTSLALFIKHHAQEQEAQEAAHYSHITRIVTYLVSLHFKVEEKKCRAVQVATSQAEEDQGLAEVTAALVAVLVAEVTAAPVAVLLDQYCGRARAQFALNIVETGSVAQQLVRTSLVYMLSHRAGTVLKEGALISEVLRQARHRDHRGRHQLRRDHRPARHQHRHRGRRDLRHQHRHQGRRDLRQPLVLHQARHRDHPGRHQLRRDPRPARYQHRHQGRRDLRQPMVLRHLVLLRLACRHLDRRAFLLFYLKVY